MTGNQGTEQGTGEEKGGVGEDDERICELFERAELGHQFGYRRDVNLLTDVLCDRLSSRLCHRCVRQTSNPTCPRLAPSESESCQCQNIEWTGPDLGRLVQGRAQMTQTTSNLYATSEEFENKTVGARRHTNASPKDLLCKRINFSSNCSRLSVGRDLKQETSSFGIGNDCRKNHADICTQTSKTYLESLRKQPFSLNMWTQTQSLPSGSDSNQLVGQKTTPGNRPNQSHRSSDWSSISESDSEGALPLNPKNTIQFYKQSLKKLKKKLAGGRDASCSDSDEDVHPRVGRVLESSHVDSYHSLSTTEGHRQTTHARSFQFTHPVLREVLSLEEPRPTSPGSIEEVIEEEEEPDFLRCHHEYDLATFFELHHLDVPVSIRKKKGKTVHRQSRSNDQRSEQPIYLKKEEMKVDNHPKQIDERLDHVGIKRLPKPGPKPSLPPPKKRQPEFHQGALNQFDVKEGTRRLSWREQAHIDRKAQFFEAEANRARETKSSSEEKRRTSTSVPAETSTVRRISLFEEKALN